MNTEAPKGRTEALDLEAIAARAAAAAVVEHFASPGPNVGERYTDPRKIAASYRDDVVALLAEVERLRAALSGRAPEGWRPISEYRYMQGWSVLVSADGVVGEARYFADEGEWWWAGFDPSDVASCAIRPQYFRPLPPPPDGEQKS